MLALPAIKASETLIPQKLAGGLSTSHTAKSMDSGLRRNDGGALPIPLILSLSWDRL